jgi:hypothetical protein
MCLKLRKKFTNPFALVSLINDDYEITFELSLFASNIKREVCDVLDFYFYFLNMKKEKLTTCCL